MPAGRPGRIGRRTSAPVVTGATATLAAAASLDDLIVALHRASANPGAGPGCTLITNIGAGGSAFFQFASAGQTTIAGNSGSSQRIGAVCYKGVRKGNPLPNLSSVGSGTGTTVAFPALTLREPGRSWVLGICQLSSSTQTMSSPSKGVVVQTGEYVQLMDSNGPVNDWSGVTATLSGSIGWNAYSLEIPSQ